MPKDFKKYYSIPASPELVYAALTNEATIRLWTGDEAEMIAEPDTEFSLWDGSITGKNLAFEAGKMIQQEWYFGEQDAPSIVSIKLHDDKGNTSLELRHTNIPEADYEEFINGWDEVYMSSLIAFYSED